MTCLRLEEAGLLTHLAGDGTAALHIDKLSVLHYPVSIALVLVLLHDLGQEAVANLYVCNLVSPVR